MKFDKRLFRLELRTKSALSVLNSAELKQLSFLATKSDNLDKLENLNENELSLLTRFLETVAPPPNAAMRRLSNRIDQMSELESNALSDSLERQRRNEKIDLRGECEKELLRRAGN